MKNHSLFFQFVLEHEDTKPRPWNFNISPSYIYFLTYSILQPVIQEWRQGSAHQWAPLGGRPLHWLSRRDQEACTGSCVMWCPKYTQTCKHSQSSVMKKIRMFDTPNIFLLKKSFLTEDSLIQKDQTILKIWVTHQTTKVRNVSSGEWKKKTLCVNCWRISHMLWITRKNLL